MFGSAFLEVAIGVSFIYVLLSLVCTTLNEMISQILGMRANNLEAGLKRILNDERLRTAFYQHPLIRSLGTPGEDNQPVRPSYIPSQTFSMVMMDVIADQVDGSKPSDEKNDSTDTFNQWRMTVEKIEQKDFKKVMLGFMNASEHKLEKTRDQLETWFDDVMDRVSGTYKRKTQTILLGLALALSVAVNADTFQIANALWQYPALREGVVAAAENYTQSHDETSSKKMSLKEMNDELKGLDLPLGWRKADIEEKTAGWWLTKIIGLIFTALAVSLGAPFWFDLLNRFVRLRSSIKPAAHSNKPSSSQT